MYVLTYVRFGVESFSELILGNGPLLCRLEWPSSLSSLSSHHNQRVAAVKQRSGGAIIAKHKRPTLARSGADVDLSTAAACFIADIST